jgi:hypothetical protein
MNCVTDERTDLIQKGNADFCLVWLNMRIIYTYWTTRRVLQYPVALWIWFCFNFALYERLRSMFTLLLCIVHYHMVWSNWPSPSVEVTLMMGSTVLFFVLISSGCSFVRIELLPWTCSVYGFAGLLIFLRFGVWRTAKQHASAPTKHLKTARHRT